MRKYIVDELKEFIEVQSNSGCKLISNEYLDCKNKISIQCRCSNTFEATFDSFKNKHKQQCNECTNNERKLKLEYIKKYCKENIDGYEVLDIKHEKKNGRHLSFALMQCHNKVHQPYWVRWQKVLKGQRCEKCFNESKEGKALKWHKDSILEILNKFELCVTDPNYEIKSSKYRILCRNKDGYLVDANINSLAQGQAPHPFQLNKHAIENLGIFCTKMGFKLMANQIWKGIKHKYVIEMEGGYKTNIVIEPLKYGSYPRAFHPSNPYSIENIKIYCMKNRPDYEIVSTGYKGRDKKLLFRYIGDKVNMSDDERYFTVPLERFMTGNQEHPWFNQSKGETVIERWLGKNNIIYTRQYTFNDCKKVKALRFDFAIFKGDSLATLIEYQGIQHYECVEHFGGEEKLKIQKENDRIKKDYCKSNKIPLLIIPYLDNKKIDDILSESLL